MATFRDKIRFAENLHPAVVWVEERTVRVKCLGGTLEIDVHPEEDPTELRKRIMRILPGIPAGLEDVKTFLEITL